MDPGTGLTFKVILKEDIYLVHQSLLHYENCGTTDKSEWNTFTLLGTVQIVCHHLMVDGLPNQSKYYFSISNALLHN